MTFQGIQKCGALLTLGAMLVVSSGSLGAANYKQQTNIVFREVHGVGLVLDVFTPTKNANGRAIVQVVSGAWYSDRGKLNDLKKALTFDIFCQRGYTVFGIRPGSRTKFTAAEMATHIEHGIRWVKEKAPEYNIDPHRIGMMGASAGGHIASLVAVKNGNIPGSDSASVQAVGVFFPPTDFLDYGGLKINPREKGGIGESLRQVTFGGGEVPDNDDEMHHALTAISPARLVTNETAPFLLIHGDADDVVPLQQSQKMLAALLEKKIDAKLIVKKGGGHPWLTIPMEIAKMADWFDSKLIDASTLNATEGAADNDLK